MIFCKSRDIYLCLSLFFFSFFQLVQKGTIRLCRGVEGLLSVQNLHFLFTLKPLGLLRSLNTSDVFLFTMTCFCLVRMHCMLREHPGPKYFKGQMLMILFGLFKLIPSSLHLK